MAQTENLAKSISYDWEIRRLAMSKKLQRLITSQLDKLQTLLNNVNEVHIIDRQDPNTWDSDMLYNLAEDLKAALKILEDQPIKGQKDEFDQPAYTDGLCSLVDTYQNEGEDEDD